MSSGLKTGEEEEDNDEDDCDDEHRSRFEMLVYVDGTDGER